MKSPSFFMRSPLFFAHTKDCMLRSLYDVQNQLQIVGNSEVLHNTVV